MTVQLTPEQYERLFLQPGGIPSKGDLSQRFANVTLLGIVSFLIALHPTAMVLMRWRAAEITSEISLTGAYYAVGGIGMWLAGIGEFILGNSFPCTVFVIFGSFWAALGFTSDPLHAIAAAFSDGSSSSPEYASGLGFYFLTWALVVFLLFCAGLRTNVAFEGIFFTLFLAFALLSAGYFKIAEGLERLDTALRLIRAAGAFAFLACCCGWYLAFALTFSTTGVSITLPIGDLSGFLAKRRAGTSMA